MHYLTKSDLEIFKQIVFKALDNKPEGYFNWLNEPTEDKSKSEIIDTFKKKLDSTYSERFLLTVSYIIAAVQKDERVALLQKTKEPNIPFNAEGWVVVSINTYPMFHISPDDLPMDELAKENLINVVYEESEEAKEHAWKNTNKPQEYKLLINWLTN